MRSVVFPMLCFSDEDEELWRNDPHEYIRKVCVGWGGVGWGGVGWGWGGGVGGGVRVCMW